MWCEYFLWIFPSSQVRIHFRWIYFIDPEQIHIENRGLLSNSSSDKSSSPQSHTLHCFSTFDEFLSFSEPYFPSKESSEFHSWKNSFTCFFISPSAEEPKECCELLSCTSISFSVLCTDSIDKLLFILSLLLTELFLTRKRTLPNFIISPKQSILTIVKTNYYKYLAWEGTQRFYYASPSGLNY